MKTIQLKWSIKDLLKNINKIEFPEFQREPTVWKLNKKQRLIDSILRDFDISSIYFYRRNDGNYDCIDGRQRINAILSFLEKNDFDEYDNGFHLKINNEIYSDKDKFKDVDEKRYYNFNNIWKNKILNFDLNIIEITKIETDHELNLLFLRLQIASILNAGEKLHAMTGEMRDFIFHKIIKHNFFQNIKIPIRRYAKEQVAAQIVLNDFSLREDKEEDFHRSRYIDLQDFFKTYKKFSSEDKKQLNKINEILNEIVKYFKDKIKLISNRALAVSVYLFIRQLVIDKEIEDIIKFTIFFEKFYRTLKWQIPKGVKMSSAYHDLLRFQTNITQAAGEKSAIKKRHNFLREYFCYYKENEKIKGDDEFVKEENKNPDNARKKIKL